MTETVVIRVESKKRHPKYHKAYTVFKKFVAHNPQNMAATGDTVVIEATRPISKTKKFVVIRKVTN